MNILGNKLLSLIGKPDVGADAASSAKVEVKKETNSAPKDSGSSKERGTDGSRKLLGFLGGGGASGDKNKPKSQEAAKEPIKPKPQTMSEIIAGREAEAEKKVAKVEAEKKAAKDKALIVEAPVSDTSGPPAAPAATASKDKEKKEVVKDGKQNDKVDSTATVTAASSSSKPGVYSLKRLRVLGNEVVAQLTPASCPESINEYVADSVFDNERRATRPLPPNLGRAPYGKQKTDTDKRHTVAQASAVGAEKKGWDRGSAAPAAQAAAAADKGKDKTNTTKAPPRAQGGWDDGGIDSGKLAEKQRLAFEAERRQILEERHGKPSAKADGTYHMEVSRSRCLSLRGLLFLCVVGT